MASPSELSLMDCKPHSYSLLLKSFGDQADHTYKLEDFLSRLEEERLKIDAFKRELPLCMQLLTNAMEASRQQLQAYIANEGTTRPVLEEFIPIKQSTSEISEKAPNIADNKANWMTSAQLWSSQANEGTKPQSTIITSPTKEAEIGFSVSPKLALLDNKQRNGGGAFLPFSKERNSSSSCQSNNPTLRVIPELALASVEKEIMEDKKCTEPENNAVSCPKRENSGKASGSGNCTVVTDQGKGAPSVASDPQTTTTTTNQTHRKARRCWSPDLHRRFVNALQMLGGSQVATPKQIRELMKVDGLTNDEVKSHLQKYRLHTRRPSPSPQAAGSPAPQLVVLGGIWVPAEYAAAAAHTGAPTIYSPHPTSHAPPQPPHYCSATPVHQEFYAAAAAPQPAPPHYQTLLHHHLQMYKTNSSHQGPPESEMRGGGERSESIEDGKSESSSWKGESGENEGKRKGLAALREEGEESSRSETTLKF